MNALLTRVLVIAVCAAGAAGCSNPVNLTTPGRMPTAAPTATPPGSPASVATSVPLGNGAALTNAPVSTAVPAPTGYAQNISVPIVNAAANTSVTLNAGTGPAAGVAPLGVGRATLSAARAMLGALHRADSPSGSFNPIFYDSVMPTNDITVAGDISVTQTFPSGALVAGTQYYLAFYDTTQASPAWQTIAGPVAPSGSTLTFSGQVSSVTLSANKLYGFATFSTTSPSATPPPAPQTLLYFGNESGVTITTETGAAVGSLDIPNQVFDLDDAGNIYAFFGSQSAPPTITKYPAGSATPSATYVPSQQVPAFVSASGAGELAAIYQPQGSGLIADVWDPGVTGAPSRTLTTSGSFLSFVMTHDGTLYLPDHAVSGAPQWDIFPPGASAPSLTIPETIVQPAQYGNFAPNYAAVGADGTLYVTEYSFQQPDPNAGLYIYPLHGAERFVATPADANGAGPQGVDVDATGNIYVVNDNSAITSGSTCQGDSLQSVTVYSSSGALQRTVAGANGAFPITVAADGTAFFSAFPVQFLQACTMTGTSGIFSIAPGATTSSVLPNGTGSSEIILYDGTHKTEPFYTGSRGAAASHAGGRGGTRAWKKAGARYIRH